MAAVAGIGRGEWPSLDLGERPAMLKRSNANETKDEVRCTCCGALLSRMSSGRIEPHLRRVHMSINLEELRQRFQV